jgi:hypothetical protein
MNLKPQFNHGDTLIPARIQGFWPIVMLTHWAKGQTKVSSCFFAGIKVFAVVKEALIYSKILVIAFRLPAVSPWLNCSPCSPRKAKAI